ncbi:MAG: hypothetical protein PHW83_07135, partial [Bacteroidales bacterium]|nr:hypothetical protein [Bacteroidales bacterium]
YEFQNYIKPQLIDKDFQSRQGCYEFQNYIKPQHSAIKALNIKASGSLFITKKQSICNYEVTKCNIF